jgi:DNA-binding response OmpR family regulator
MDGLEFVKRLSRTRRVATDRVRIIFMSADSSRETLNAALPLGVVAYIVKPPRMAELKSKMEAALADL